MKDQTLVDKFIELRARDWTFARIAAELQVAKSTLIDWSRKYQFQIQNLRSIEQEAAAQQLELSREHRWQTLSRALRRVHEELAKRDLSQVPTARLLRLEIALRNQARREFDQPQFSSALADVPPDQQVKHIVDWKP